MTEHILLDEKTALWHRQVTSEYAFGAGLTIHIRPLYTQLPGISLPRPAVHWPEILDSDGKVEQWIWENAIEQVYRYHATIDRTITDGTRRGTTAVIMQGGTRHGQTLTSLPCDAHGRPPRTRVCPVLRPVLGFTADDGQLSSLTQPMATETYELDRWPDPKGWWVYRLRGSK